MKIEDLKEKLAALFIKEKEKVFSIAVIMAFAVIAVITYNNQAKELKALNTRKAAEVQKNTVLNDIKQSEKRLEFYKNLLKVKDPDSASEIINSIAKDTGVKVISIKAGAQEKQPLYVKYPLVLTISTESYHAIGKFIGRIENYSDAYSVDAVNIIKQATAKDQPQQPEDKLTVSISLTVIAFTG